MDIIAYLCQYLPKLLRQETTLILVDLQQFLFFQESLHLIRRELEVITIRHADGVEAQDLSCQILIPKLIEFS